MTRALLVIDIQNEYFPSGAVPLWEPEHVEACIVSAISLARAAATLSFWCSMFQPQRADFAAGGSGTAIRPAVLAAAGEAPIVTKQYADAFQDTDLSKYLVETDELLVAGMMTQNCIVFTAMSRAAESLRVKVVGDLCTAPTEVVHRIALNALGSKLTL